MSHCVNCQQTVRYIGCITLDKDSCSIGFSCQWNTRYSPQWDGYRTLILKNMYFCCYIPKLFNIMQYFYKKKGKNIRDAFTAVIPMAWKNRPYWKSPKIEEENIIFDHCNSWESKHIFFVFSLYFGVSNKHGICHVSSNVFPSKERHGFLVVALVPNTNCKTGDILYIVSSGYIFRITQHLRSSELDTVRGQRHVFQLCTPSDLGAVCIFAAEMSIRPRDSPIFQLLSAVLNTGQSLLSWWACTEICLCSLCRHTGTTATSIPSKCLLPFAHSLCMGRCSLVIGEWSRASAFMWEPRSCFLCGFPQPASLLCPLCCLLAPSPSSPLALLAAMQNWSGSGAVK